MWSRSPDGPRPIGPVMEQIEGPAHKIIAATDAGWAKIGVNLRAVEFSDFRQRGSPLCWEHSWSDVIGRVTRLEFNAEGLVGEIRFGTSPFARQIRDGVDSGRITGVSIGIDALGRLVEVSLTHRPLDEKAATSGRIVLRLRT